MEVSYIKGGHEYDCPNAHVEVPGDVDSHGHACGVCQRPESK